MNELFLVADTSWITVPGVLAIIIAYFLGNISPAIILGKMNGIDIRTGITMVVDILKGFIGVKLGFLLGGYVVGTLCAVSAFCGHIWPALYSFRGGKGVATAFGVITAVDWKLGLAVLAVVAVFVILTKRMSVGSIMGAVSFPLLAWLLEPGFFVPGFIMAIIVVVKHRANIGRLMRGEEPKMSFKK